MLALIILLLVDDGTVDAGNALHNDLWKHLLDRLQHKVHLVSILAVRVNMQLSRVLLEEMLSLELHLARSNDRLNDFIDLKLELQVVDGFTVELE